jgi:predicted DNA-binding protein YlxM (UPF0122 family)
MLGCPFLEGTDGGMLMKDTLLTEIMSQFHIGKSAAYNSIEKASSEGRIAESSKHVVTLVKPATELVAKLEEKVMEGNSDGHFQVSNVENE